MGQATLRLSFPDNRTAAALFGPQGDHLARLGDLLGVKIASRGADLSVTGPQDGRAAAAAALQALHRRLREGLEVTPAEVEAAARFARAAAPSSGEGSAASDRLPADGSPPAPPSALPPGAPGPASTFVPGDRGGAMGPEPRLVTARRTVTPRTPGQARAVQALLARPLVFLAGPAGTGKTYLAVAAAVAALEKGEVERIILSRPAVEAGERLGFLPGDLQEKVDPYLRPLYDALAGLLGPEAFARRARNRTLEIAPLAFLRGRTLADAFIILDEAQNTTQAQMMMFLTRLGGNGRMAVVGDLEQVDLPPGMIGGFADAWARLEGMEGLAAVRLGREDVVRHAMIAEILRRYALSGQRGGRGKGRRPETGTGAGEGGSA